MRRLFILLLVIISLFTTSYAFLEDFYLKTKKDVEKLIPNTLNDTLNPGESATFYVDILPKGVIDEINWQIKDPIATLTCDGTKCTVTAIAPGDTRIYATASNGVSCSTQIKISRTSPQILLESEDVANSGESIIIKAYPSTADSVTWRVEGVDANLVSFGGNMCKIKPRKAGKVKVSASLGETTVSKTVEILPTKNTELDLNSLSLFLAGCGVILLLIILIYGRGYEKKR